MNIPLGLPGQGIDPSTGNPVGGYVVRDIESFSFLVLNPEVAPADLGWRFRQLLRVSHQICSIEQHCR